MTAEYTAFAQSSQFLICFLKTRNGIEIWLLINYIFLHLKYSCSHDRNVFIPFNRNIIIITIAAVF